MGHGQGFKTGDTTIKRTEISSCRQCHVAEHRVTCERAGYRADTILYKNFAALKAAWNLDAINNDDEPCTT